MPHEVLGNLFFQDRKAPAWHGIMADDIEMRDYTAAEVYSLFGKPDVRKVKLQSESERPDGTHLAVPYSALVRGPVKDDPKPRVFGVVSEDYALVTPSEITELWDAEVARKIQTMMFLREGRLMVITCKLEGFSVAGEEVESYCQIGNWMDGANASTALVSRVCTVCMNTWNAANSSALDKYKFVHDQHIKYRMTQWFKDVLARADGSTPEARAVMEAMTVFKLTRDNAANTVNTVLHAAYPAPPALKTDRLDPPEVAEARAKTYEMLKHTVDVRRLTALDLIKGNGMGMNLPSRKNTLWGVYQGVCEVEDYRKGATGDGLASSILFGERGAAKDRAFSAAVSLLS